MLYNKRWVIKLQQLGEMIVSKTLNRNNKKIDRVASRGIIRNGNMVLMIHCAFYDDYTFPGGGVECGEDPVYALCRECMEEAGVVIKNVRPFYKIVEEREMDEFSYMHHESLFYLCDVEKTCEQHLEPYEVELGYNPVWISIDEAIKNNINRMNMLKDTDYKGVLERELRILYKLKESEL